MSRAHRRNPVQDETGAAMVEFALVFPLQLLFTLGIMQLALLYIGHMVVHYAAFQAARAALVTDGSRFKTERAAEIACAAITGKSAERGGLYSVTNLAALKTSVRIIDQGEHSHEVSVEVTHDFELVIPVINEIFAFDYKSFLWFGGASRPSAEDAVNRWLQAKYGSPHLRIVKSCVVVKPWKTPSR